MRNAEQHLPTSAFVLFSCSKLCCCFLGGWNWFKFGKSPHIFIMHWTLYKDHRQFECFMTVYLYRTFRKDSIAVDIIRRACMIHSFMLVMTDVLKRLHCSLKEEIRQNIRCHNIPGFFNGFAASFWQGVFLPGDIHVVSRLLPVSSRWCGRYSHCSPCQVQRHLSCYTCQSHHTACVHLPSL